MLLASRSPPFDAFVSSGSSSKVETLRGLRLNPKVDILSSLPRICDLLAKLLGDLSLERLRWNAHLEDFRLPCLPAGSCSMPSLIGLIATHVIIFLLVHQPCLPAKAPATTSTNINKHSKKSQESFAMGPAQPELKKVRRFIPQLSSQEAGCASGEVRPWLARQ